MKNILQIIGKSILILACSVIVGFLLLLAAFLVPVKEQNVQDSCITLQSTEWYPSVQQGNIGGFGEYLPDVLDGGTDYLMIKTAAYQGGEESLPERVMYMANDKGETYAYYWHGYVSILRPLLYLFDYGMIRMINFLGQAALVILLAMELVKRGKRYVLMLLSSYVLLMPLALSLSLQFSWVFYIGMIGSMLLVKKQAYFREKNRYLYLFLCLGIATSYFDLLTYPLFTWGVPCIWWIVTDESEAPVTERLKQVVSSGIMWILGYALMWISKWRLANFILKQDVYSLAMDEVHFRSGTEEGAGYYFYERLIAASQNWKHYEYTVYALILFAWFSWFMFHVVRGEYRRRKDTIIYILISLSSVVWYFALANHTTVHHFFTYRIYNVGILAFMAIMVKCVTVERKQMQKKDYAVMFGMAACIAVISLIMTLSAKEQLRVWNVNGWNPDKDISITEGETVEFSFIPTFPRIISFGIGMQSEEKRSYEISVKEGDRELYRETVSQKNNDEADIARSVNWKLKPGEKYTLQIKLLKGSDDVRIMMTGNEGLAEYQGDQMSNKIGGQPGSHIVYYIRPYAVTTLLFLFCTWLGMLCTAAFSLRIKR